MIPLQVSWFIDYAPPWLSFLLITTGLGISTAKIFTLIDNELSSYRRLLGGIMTGSGVAILFYGVLLDYAVLSVGVTLLVARYIEGLAAVRLYQKISHMIRKHRYPSEYVIGISGKAKFYLIGLFLLILSGWIFIYVLIWGSMDFAVQRTIRFYWTLVTVVLSIIGLTIRFWGFKNDLPIFLLIGVILFIVGSEIYNLATIRLEIGLYILSTTAYSIGFWTAGLSVIRNQKVNLIKYFPDEDRPY